MPDLFAATENSFKSRLRSAVARLAADDIFIGTSSWEYADWRDLCRIFWEIFPPVLDRCKVVN